MKKIMIVDDENDQIFTIKTTLDFSSDDYDIITANSGMECLNHLKNEEHPDLILLDIMMPDMNGWEVLRKIRENPEWNDIRIVFLTARTDKVAEDAGGFLGDGFIEKPFENDELINKINTLLKDKKSN
jgi:CheY-like chemotaxis protein